MLYLQSERLVLRSFCTADLETFVAYRSQPEVARYQTWEAPYERQLAERFIAEMLQAEPGGQGQWYQLAIERKRDHLHIGDCAFCVLREDFRQAEIGVTLAREHQGQGYGSEAANRLLDYLFGELGLHRVRALCDEENAASARLLERIGMRREGHFLQSFWLKGCWSSEYLYALLREEWAGRRSSQQRPCLFDIGYKDEDCARST